MNFVGHREELTLGTMPDPEDPKKTAAAAYPSFSTSRSLALRNVVFAFTNWDFSLLMGGIYFLFAALISLRDRPDVYALIAAVFGASLIGYTIKQEVSNKFKIWSTAAVHAAAHVVVLVCAALRHRVRQRAFRLEWRMAGGLEMVRPSARRLSRREYAVRTEHADHVPSVRGAFENQPQQICDKFRTWTMLDFKLVLRTRGRGVIHINAAPEHVLGIQINNDKMSDYNRDP
ncbi:hypothetical protein [Bradyrhizobium sp. USDA 10063]